jgi:phenylalanyl-tRNA synthetase beta subunit
MTLTDYIEKNSLAPQKLVVPDISVRPPFKEWSLYPCIVRDVAVWVLEKDKERELETIAQDFAKAYCVVPARIFDRFEQTVASNTIPKTSIAYRFVFQSYEKTLTHEEVEGFMKHFLKRLDTSVFELR